MVLPLNAKDADFEPLVTLTDLEKLAALGNLIEKLLGQGLAKEHGEEPVTIPLQDGKDDRGKTEKYTYTVFLFQQSMKRS